MSESDAEHKKKSVELRQRFPRMASALDDFYLMRSCPQLFDFRAMPQGWQDAQRIFAGEYERIGGGKTAQTTKDINIIMQLLKGFGGVR